MPISFALFGIATEVREEQFWKARFPICITPSFIRTDLRDVHAAKTASAKCFILPGMVTEVRELP
ncbi:hypothetical protein Barb4_04339 [Bacteroidales bacterium Barb4]|nr:hypothetical protein Barb4_04339 [Bacteroidales bacterium Barb4]